MSSKTKVSKQVKVTQGKHTTTFELTAKSLVIEQTDGGPAFTRTILNQAGIDALRELIQPSIKERFEKSRDESRLARKEAENRLTLSPEQFDERFGDGSPPREDVVIDEGQPAKPGLQRQADGVVEGMD